MGTDIQRRKSAVAWLSVISNTVLVAGKVIVGLLIGSVSVISEAIHSGVDLVAAVIALVAVKESGKPADTEHPFGHGKIENVSGTIEALLIFVAAGWIIFEAVEKLRHPEPIKALGWGMAVMFVSAVVNIFVSQRLFTVGRETDSVALQADAVHLRTDVYTSAGVMASLGLIMVGGIVFPQIPLDWLDPAAAIVVALLIIHAAYKLTLQSARDLLDVRLPAGEEVWIRRYIARMKPEVYGFHRLRTRKAGPTRFVEFHLIVERGMSVEESHHISDRIVSDIKEHFPGAHVTVHIEPCTGQCSTVCLDGCLLTSQERSAIQQEEGEKLTTDER